MSNQLWTDQRVRDRVKAKMRHYKLQGAAEMPAEAIAYSVVCEEMRNEYEVVSNVLYAEYRALWDTVIGFMNSPGNLESTAVEPYREMVQQAMKSRFWNKWIEAQDALTKLKEAADKPPDMEIDSD